MPCVNGQGSDPVLASSPRFATTSNLEVVATKRSGRYMNPPINENVQLSRVARFGRRHNLNRDQAGSLLTRGLHRAASRGS